MQRKIITSRSGKFIKFATLTKSWHPVNRNGWWVKFSTYCDSNILLTFISAATGQTVIRYFSDESKAVDFINYLINTEPTDEFPQQHLPE